RGYAGQRYGHRLAGSPFAVFSPSSQRTGAASAGQKRDADLKTSEGSDRPTRQCGGIVGSGGDSGQYSGGVGGSCAVRCAHQS
ncbi:hypothetical protein, partial [Vibrio penaeicida]|uniref:hypothetical protein n=1 Tax=Vibrio penaeicida TaxID=104609 RepID=UPI00142E85E1